MGEASAYGVVGLQRENLCLVLKPLYGSGENRAVEVSFELAAMIVGNRRLSPSVGVEQPAPVHAGTIYQMEVTGRTRSRGLCEAA